MWWQFRTTSGSWTTFNKRTTQDIERTYLQGKHESQVQMGEKVYFLDLRKMTFTNPRSSRFYPLRRRVRWSFRDSSQQSWWEAFNANTCLELELAYRDSPSGEGTTRLKMGKTIYVFNFADWTMQNPSNPHFLRIQREDSQLPSPNSQSLIQNGLNSHEIIHGSNVSVSNSQMSGSAQPFQMPSQPLVKSPPSQETKDLELLFDQIGISTKYVKNFTDNELKQNDFLSLSKDDVKDLIPAIGPRNRFMRHLEFQHERLRQLELEPTGTASTLLESSLSDTSDTVATTSATATTTAAGATRSYSESSGLTAEVTIGNGSTQTFDALSASPMGTPPSDVAKAFGTSPVSSSGGPLLAPQHQQQRHDYRSVSDPGAGERSEVDTVKPTTTSPVGSVGVIGSSRKSSEEIPVFALPKSVSEPQIAAPNGGVPRSMDGNLQEQFVIQASVLKKRELENMNVRRHGGRHHHHHHHHNAVSNDQLPSFPGKVEELQDNEMCCICMEKKKNFAFGPCGHIVCCDNCQQKLFTCPACRSFIATRMEVFT